MIVALVFWIIVLVLAIWVELGLTAYEHARRASFWKWPTMWTVDEDPFGTPKWMYGIFGGIAFLADRNAYPPIPDEAFQVFPSKKRMKEERKKNRLIEGYKEIERRKKVLPRD